MKRVSLVDMNEFAHHLKCLDCGLVVKTRAHRLTALALEALICGQ